ncbi:uncharacterized protein [Watersipora subatra]|uniref:uncharacterized protein n=1 Tax=Watersipora subatra TaxID=2589382 RepID=UPI00355C9A80
MENFQLSEEVKSSPAARERYELLRSRLEDIDELLKEGSIVLDEEGELQYRTLKDSMEELERAMTTEIQTTRTSEKGQTIWNKGAKIAEAGEISERERFSGQGRSGPMTIGDTTVRNCVSHMDSRSTHYEDKELQQLLTELDGILEETETTAAQTDIDSERLRSCTNQYN